MKKLTIIPTKVLGRCINDKKTKDLLVELYALVNYSKATVMGREILPGQLITTLSELEERTGLTKKMVRNRLDWLCAHQYIYKETNRHCLKITIVGYSSILKGSDTLRTQKWAHLNSCKPGDCIEETNQVDTKEGTPKAYNKNINKNVVAPTADIPLEERQKKLKEDVIGFLKSRGLYEAMQDEPAMKIAVKNFLSYYGEAKDEEVMPCERVANFRVDYFLLKWLRNEYSLKNIIKI